MIPDDRLGDLVQQIVDIMDTPYMEWQVDEIKRLISDYTKSIAEDAAVEYPEPHRMPE